MVVVAGEVKQKKGERDFGNVRLAGTLVSMKLICPHSEEQRMPQP